MWASGGIIATVNTLIESVHDNGTTLKVKKKTTKTGQHDPNGQNEWNFCTLGPCSLGVSKHSLEVFTAQLAEYLLRKQKIAPSIILPQNSQITERILELFEWNRCLVTTLQQCAYAICMRQCCIQLTCFFLNENEKSWKILASVRLNVFPSIEQFRCELFETRAWTLFR